MNCHEFDNTRATLRKINKNKVTCICSAARRITSKFVPHLNSRLDVHNSTFNSATILSCTAVSPLINNASQISPQSSSDVTTNNKSQDNQSMFLSNNRMNLLINSQLVAVGLFGRKHPREEHVRNNNNSAKKLI